MPRKDVTNNGNGGIVGGGAPSVPEVPSSIEVTTDGRNDGFATDTKLDDSEITEGTVDSSKWGEV